MKLQNNYTKPASLIHQISYTYLTDQAITCKSPEKMQEIYATIGEEHELALLFLDIRNSTAAMEIRSSYEVLYMIRKLFVLFNHSIKAAGGRIIETNGDSIYAVFGLETSIENAVQSAVDAAYAVLQDVETFNSSYAYPYFNLNYEVGIGLHKGNVVVGRYNPANKDQLSVMGLPVNITARLREETKELNNNLLISEIAWQLLLQPKNAESRSVSLKGVSDRMKVRLLGQPFHTKNTAIDMDLDYYLGISG